MLIFREVILFLNCHERLGYRIKICYNENLSLIVFLEIEKMSTSNEPSSDEDVINRNDSDTFLKTFLDSLLKIKSPVSLIEKENNELKPKSAEKPQEYINGNTVKTTTQRLSDTGGFDGHGIAYEVLKDRFIFNGRRR